MDTILIVPGLNDSCGAHWQSWFEATLPGCVRVRQRDWTAPDLRAWSAAVREAAEAAGPGRIWIVAHSFGCLAAVQAAASVRADIAGAMLVAPADPAKFGLAFALPRTPLPFPTLLVGSANDPWMSLDRARFWARAWGAQFIDAGRAGHINTASGHGPWPEGLGLLAGLRRAASRRAGAGALCGRDEASQTH